MMIADQTPSNALPGAYDFRLGMKVRSFRAFRDETSINLRPLTLLYGHNQAGKSSLLRLVALLADSLRPDVQALDLQSPTLRGASFKELGWMGREPAFSPWLTLSAPRAEHAPTLSLQFSDDGGPVVNRVKLVHGEHGDKFIVSLDAVVSRAHNQLIATYTGTYRGNDWSGTLTFNGLIPEGLPPEAAAIARDVRAALEPLARTQWLHANRLADGPAQTRPVRCCSADGSDLAGVLQPSGYRPIIEAASAWIAQQNGLGKEIAIHRDPDGRPRFVIGNPGREHLPLHLAGEGLRALLPMLLCACWAELGRRGDDSGAPSLLAFEEPEAHLHPDLQIAFFKRLIEAVRSGVPVVLETHSVYILRAMQLAVLEERIDPASIGLYWVGQDADGVASVTPIKVGGDAALSGWRPLAFEQEQDLAHEILDRRWKQLEAK